LRRWYAEDTLDRVRVFWGFYQGGFPPKRACELATRALEEAGGDTSEFLSFSPHPGTYYCAVKARDQSEGSAGESAVVPVPFSAPGKPEEEKLWVVDIAAVRSLTLAALRMVEHLGALTYLVPSDDVACLLVGASSVLVNELRPDDSGPVLVPRGGLGAAVKDGRLVEGSEAAVVFGLLQSLQQTDDVLGELSAAKVVVRRVIALRSELRSEEEATLKDRGIEFICLLGRRDVDRLPANPFFPQPESALAAYYSWLKLPAEFLLRFLTALGPAASRTQPVTAPRESVPPRSEEKPVPKAVAPGRDEENLVPVVF